MGRPKKGNLEVYVSLIGKVISFLEEYDAMRTKSMVETLKLSVIDFKRLVASEDVEKVLIFDPRTRKSVLVGMPLSELQALRATDPEAYEEYRQNLEEFMAYYTKDSLFAQMFGEHGEKILLPEVGHE